MRRVFPLLLALACGLPGARGDVLRREVEGDILYLHPTDLGVDAGVVCAALQTDKKVVLDLRKTATTHDATHLLVDAFEKNQGGKTPVQWVLLNLDTALELRAAFSDEVGDSITLAPAAPGLSCDVPIATELTADQEAAAALAGGADPAVWTNETFEKQRFDEASLVAVKAPPPILEESSKPSPQEAVKITTPPKIDRVLQRALQLCRVARLPAGGK